MNTDVQVHGAGLVGRWIARGLRAAGVNVHLVQSDDPQRPPSGLVLPVHPEHLHRFANALGPAALDVATFAQASVRALPGLVPSGVDWMCRGDEAGDGAASLAAAPRLGVGIASIEGGFHLNEGGWIDVDRLFDDVPEPWSTDAVSAEIDVYTTPAMPWLRDRTWPVRWHGITFAAPALGVPQVSRQASVFAGGGLDLVGARWADAHLGVGDSLTSPPSDRVVNTLRRLAEQDFGLTSTPQRVWTTLVSESCDGLPIIGPIPGRPRLVACCGFGASELTYGVAAARSVVDGVLGRGGVVPIALRSARLA